MKEVCTNHNDRPAEYMCEQCGKAFCYECKVSKTIEAITIDLCPACGAKLFELDAKAAKKSVAKEEAGATVSFQSAIPTIPPGKIIANALEDWQYASNLEVLTVVATQSVFFAAFLALADTLLPGILFFLIVPAAVTISYIMEALRGAAEDTDLFADPLSSREFFFNVIADTIRFLASLIIPASFLGAVALVWVYVLGKNASQLLTIPFFMNPMSIGAVALATLFWPMAFAQAAQKKTVWEILWPLNKLDLFRGGGNLLVQWLVMLAEAVFIYILVLVGLKLFPMVDIFFVHGLVVAIFFALGVSTFIAFARTVGRTVAQAQGAAATVQEQPGEQVEGDEEYMPMDPMAQNIQNHAESASMPQQPSSSTYDSQQPSYGDYGMVETAADPYQYELSLAVENHNMGKLAEAEGYYRKILSQNSSHQEALAGYFNLLVQMQRGGEVQDMALSVLRVAHAGKNYPLAVDVWREVMNVNPRFTLPGKALYFVARAMHEENQFQDAATLYRKVAQENANSPMAATSLIRCAEVLGFKLGRKDIAQQMLGYVKKNYPQTPQEAEAEQILQDLLGEMRS